MTLDIATVIQGGALGVLVMVLCGVGYGVKLWAAQSKELTTQVLQVVSDNSKVVSQNTDAIDKVHTSLEGVRNDVRDLTMRVASQPCQAEDIAERMIAVAKTRLANKST